LAAFHTIYDSQCSLHGFSRSIFQ